MKSRSFLSFCFLGLLAGLAPSAFSQNTSYGTGALPTNSGSYNTALGLYSLYNNSSGLYNNGVGTAALASNTTGSNNSAVGLYSCYGNTAGLNNCGLGNQTLQFNAVGNGNVAIGLQALLQCTGSNNIGIGTQGGFLLTNGNNNICIGNSGVAAESNTIRIGTQGLHTATVLAGNVSTNGNVNALGTVNTTVIGPGFRHIVGSTELQSYVVDGSAWFGSSTNHSLQLMTNNSTKMTITGDGRVGIGTTGPTRALVEISGVSGSTPYSPGGAARGVLKFDGAFSFTNSGTQTNVSLYASNAIYADFYVAFSDERIKRVQGLSNGDQDLNSLMRIEVTDYTYIDVATRGAGKQKKVIAQQVEKVYPQAVHRGTDVLPDIYKVGDVKDGWVDLKTNLKKGERVRLIGDKKDGIHEVLEVEESRFRTDFVADGNDVFVYGREVKDFRNVDYDAISMLNVSATQALARKLAATDAEIAALKEQLAVQAAKDKAFEARLALLEQSSSGAARAVKVAATK